MGHVITKGDKVTVYFTDRLDPEFDVTIKYTPSEPGDSFLVERKDGTLVEIMSFAKMVRATQ